ncbi:ribonuclease III [Alternaria panax]|uniref:Ribonuclease III n=1 Tax=Alternaria panax TaxID=48097 RepID=A0AAD4NUL8_9PLEO|nr:ribonuclease III [Alternaria panax]
MLPQIEMKAVDIESLLQYTFTDKRIAVEAVQMAAPQIACMHNNNFEGLDNNKRLSVLGNAVLAKVLCGAWFEARDPSGQARSQAQWTQLRNDMLSNDALAPRGYQAGLDELVIVADSRPAVSPKMVATSLEAIIGAVYHDGGDEAALRVMNSLGFFDHPLLTLPAVNFPPLQPLYSFTPKATFATTCVTEVVEPPARIDAQIAGVESAIGWVFKDKSFCATALQMQTKLGVTLTFGGSDYFTEHNKVLEQMGDRIMLAVLCKKWLQSQEYSYNLLQWHKTQQSLISNAALAERGFALGLDAFVIRNSGTPAVSKYMMANTFEAIFGAVYMDAGEAGSKAVYHVLEHTGFIKDMLLSGTILADL